MNVCATERQANMQAREQCRSITKLCDRARNRRDNTDTVAYVCAMWTGGSWIPFTGVCSVINVARDTDLCDTVGLAAANNTDYY